MFNKRYSRQLLIDIIGEIGQDKLASSKALVIGAGGLGSPVLYYLAAAGVGTLGIVDNDNVEISNLNRQILHFTSDIGIKKVVSAQNKLNSINTDIKINIYDLLVTKENVLDIIEGYDIVIDCVDNLETRFIVNDACCKKDIVLIEAGVSGFEGFVMTILPNKTPCLRGLFSQNCAAAQFSTPFGVLGATAGIVGSLQAIQAIKQLLKLVNFENENVLLFNFLEMSFEKLKLNNFCEYCNDERSIKNI
jgi:adenylyltransferase/sulfurtransferase